MDACTAASRSAKLAAIHLGRDSNSFTLIYVRAVVSGVINQGLLSYEETADEGQNF